MRVCSGISGVIIIIMHYDDKNTKKVDRINLRQQSSRTLFKQIHVRLIH